MEIFIVPVAHVSSESVKRVRNAIESLKPDIVAVELDEERFRALSEGTKPALRDMIFHPFMAMLYLFQQAMGRGFGVEPGGEMLVAVKAAQEHGVPVAFVDRHIGITASRLARIPLREKLSIVFQILISPLAFIPNPFAGGQRLTLEAIGKAELPEEVFEEFRRRLPNAYRVLVEERDEHMFRSVSSIAAEKVVLVVGAGHLSGLKKRLDASQKQPAAGFAS